MKNKKNVTKKEVMIKRIVLVIVLLALVGVIIALVVNKDKLNNGTGDGNNQQSLITEAKQYNRITFTDLKFEDTDDPQVCNLKFTIKNESGDVIEEQTADIVFFNEEDTEIQRFTIAIPRLDPGAETQTEALVSTDLKNAKSYNFEAPLPEDDKPAEETPAEEAPAEETPAEEAPAETQE